MPTQRQRQINNLLQAEIAQILQRDVSDPLIGFATITGVDVSVDLSHARVFVSVYGSQEDKRDTIRGLIRSRRFIRGLLGDRIRMRKTPKLSFHLDETPEKAQRMERLLRDLAQDDGNADEPAPD